MRRFLGTVLLVVVAAAAVLAAAPAAVAATQPKAGPAERFGTRLVDVPVSEANIRVPRGTSSTTLRPEPRSTAGSSS
jgi:hypothetical protein